MPVALSAPQECLPTDQNVHAENHNKVPATSAATKLAVELPLEGWDPQQFKVVAELIQEEPLASQTWSVSHLSK